MTFPLARRLPVHIQSNSKLKLRRGLAGLLLGFALLAVAGNTGGCRAEQPWPLWEHYADHMLDGSGRIIDHLAGDRTTSEGQAYGMFFALVANDRARFDRMLNWTESNLAGGDLTLRLPAWSWGKNPDGSWKTLDPNPASDADLWLAYDLLEAGRLWREPRYEKLGTMIATRIAQGEVTYVPGLGLTLLPGPLGFHVDNDTWIVNPSYLPPPVLARLAVLMPDGPWLSVLHSLEPMLRDPSHARFAMDWVSAIAGSVRASASPVQLARSDKAAEPVGSYDAIRVYLWLGLADKDTPGLASLLASVSGMGSYLKTSVTPPLEVTSSGQVRNSEAPAGFSAAAVPYLAAIGMRSEQRTQLNRLSAMRAPATGLYGKDPAYYDQNLALFATGWTENRFHFDRTGKLIVHWH